MQNTQPNNAPAQSEAGTRLNTYEYSSSNKKTTGGVANEKKVIPLLIYSLQLKQTYVFKEPTGEISGIDKKVLFSVETELIF